MENELLRQELNPFMPGAGMQPPELVGRERDLEIVDRMIARTKLNNLDRGIIFSASAASARRCFSSSSRRWQPGRTCLPRR